MKEITPPRFDPVGEFMVQHTSDYLQVRSNISLIRERPDHASVSGLLLSEIPPVNDRNLLCAGSSGATPLTQRLTAIVPLGMLPEIHAFLSRHSSNSNWSHNTFLSIHVRMSESTIRGGIPEHYFNAQPEPCRASQLYQCWCVQTLSLGRTLAASHLGVTHIELNMDAFCMTAEYTDHTNRKINLLDPRGE